MATGVTGYLDFEATKGFTLRVHYAETYDIATNKSDSLTITKLQIYSEQWGNTYWHYLNGTISVNGTTVVTMNSSITTHKALISVGSWVDCSGTLGGASDISHAADGSKNVSIAVDVTGYAEAWAPMTESGSGWKIASTQTLALTTIPRASSFSVSNGTLNTAQNLTVTKAVDSFTHTITYVCGTASGTVCTKSGSTSVSFTPPLSLASQNTTGTSLSVTFTLQTYSGDTAIGNPVTKTVTMAIPASVKPSLTLALSDDMGYANKYGAYVKSLSKLKVVVNPVAAYGSEIVSYNITALGNTYNTKTFVTDVLNTSGTLTVKATVTDRRGRTSDTVSMNYTVLDYIAPAISSISAIRCNSDGSANPQGAFLKVTFSANITALNNKNAAVYTLKYKKSSASNWETAPASAMPSSYAVTDHIYIFAAEGSPYDIEIKAVDDHGSMTRFTAGPAAIFLIAPHESGSGLGLGMKPTHETGLDIGFDVYFYGNKTHGFFPIGAVYAEANNEDPASRFGGTWDLVNSTAVPGVYFWKRIL